MTKRLKLAFMNRGTIARHTLGDLRNILARWERIWED